MQLNDTICALSTAPGMGAIAVIRLSGAQSISILKTCFTPFKSALSLDEVTGYNSVFGKFSNGKQTIDEVLVSFFKNPKSYTGEDVVEISCHGSIYIQEQILQALLNAGCRMAEPGEFTLRAFFNGKMDLTQAEAVADLIASENKASHQLAMQHMRGGFGDEIRALREELINFASLIELELDFGEEDVEFADRSALSALLHKIKSVITRLISSFETGNVLKNGVPVAIVGAPNAGKSTLLNALLNEERAIVTEIAGTTRDAIEDELNLDGVKYRFIDTAGIRETEDVVETIGIKKTFEKIDEAKVVLYLFDAGRLNTESAAVQKSVQEQIQAEIQLLKGKTLGKTLLLLANKADLLSSQNILSGLFSDPLLYLSAKNKTGLETLLLKLKEQVNLSALIGNQSIISNSRHLKALQLALADVQRVENGMANNISGDFLAMDIREAMKHLGSIVGEIDTDKDILGTIFGKFCIGK